MKFASKKKAAVRNNRARYILFWSGNLNQKSDFMVRSSITSNLENLPIGHPERTMSMRLPLKNMQYATLLSAYAPTLQADTVEKRQFYSELRNLLQSIPAYDKVIILGDFNARVGYDGNAWQGKIDRNWVGNCNGNGPLLFEFCTEQQSVINNTVFQQKDSWKTTWMHPRSKHPPSPPTS